MYLKIWILTLLVTKKTLKKLQETLTKHQKEGNLLDSYSSNIVNMITKNQTSFRLRILGGRQN
jgi:hypothetical protein